MATVYDDLKTALLAQLDTLFPLASHPVFYYELKADIEEYATARAAQAALSGGKLSGYSNAGRSFSYRDSSQAGKAAGILSARLACWGFSTGGAASSVIDLTEAGRSGNLRGGQ